MGMSFFFASGDDGVAGDGFCFNEDGSGGIVIGIGNFIANYPSACPYVTSVGATQLPAGSSVCTVGYYSPLHSILTASYITGD